MSSRLRNLMLAGANFRLPVLLATIAITIFTALGIQRLEVDTSMDSLISNDDPQAALYDSVVDEFGSDNTIAVFVRDPELWSVERLTALQELQYALEELDHIERIESVFTASSVRGMDDFVEVQPLLPYVPDDLEAIANARGNALYSPLIQGNLVSPDGNATILQITLTEQALQEAPDGAIHAGLDAVLSQFAGRFEQLFQLGSPRIRAELQQSLFSDLAMLGPLSGGILIACIVLFVRSGFAAILPLLTSGLSIIWAFGLLGWLGVPLNILSAMLPSLIIVMGSTEDTHILAGYLRELAEQPDAEDADPKRLRFKLTMSTMRHLGAPVILTTLTTVIGLGTNLLSDVGLIVDFGIAATLALALNGVLTMLLVPMILATFGPTRPPGPAAQRHLLRSFSDKLLDLFNHLRCQFGNQVLVITLVLAIALAVAASQMKVSNDPLSYFKSEHALVGDVTTIQQNMAGSQMFYLHIEASEPDAFRKPEYLRKLLEVQGRLRTFTEFKHSVSIADYIALVNREWLGGAQQQYRIPDDEALIAQYLLFFHQRDIARYISHDGKRVNVVIRHNLRESQQLNEEIARASEIANEVLKGSAQAHFVGKNLMVNATAERLMTSQMRSLVLLLAAVFLMMSVLFTSFRGGLISMIPNLLPIIFTFGLMTLAGVPINPGTATVAVIAIGIAIDDTIHLLTRYNEEARRTVNTEDAIRKTLQAESIPVISTSISLMLGFASLTLSDFSIIAQFGVLSAAAMLFALLADLLITPILMSKIRLVSLWDILTLRLDPDVIRNSELFYGMSTYQVRKAILLSEIRSFEPDEVIIEQGATESEMFLLLQGRVEILLRQEDRTIHLADSLPGSILGEVGFVGPIQRTAEVRAADKVQLLVFEASRVRQGMRFYPHIAAKLNLNISAVLGSRLAENILRLREMSDDRRHSHRFSIWQPARLITDGQNVLRGSVKSLSPEGAVIHIPAGHELNRGDSATLDMGNIGTFRASVIRNEANNNVVMQLEASNDERKDLLAWLRTMAHEGSKLTESPG